MKPVFGRLDPRLSYSLKSDSVKLEQTFLAPYAAKNRPGSDDGRFGAVDKQTRPKYVKATAEI